jgi:hypothetical protein
MRELLYFLPQRRVSGSTDARGPVSFASRNGDQNVLLCPSTIYIDLLELAERYLELFGPTLERGNRIGER